MSLFSRRIPGLQALFPSSGQEVASPNEVTELVHLVHSWPGAAEGFLRAQSLQATSNSTLNPTITVLAPTQTALPQSTEEYFEVLAVDISHDSATVRNLTVFLRNELTLLNTQVARFSAMTSVQAAGAPGGFMPLFGVGFFAGAQDAIFARKPFHIPPRYSLLIVGDAAGINYSITVSAVVIRHSIHETPTRG